MTGEQLWKSLLGAQIPDDQLYELAKDLFWARKNPSGGAPAIQRLASAARQHPAILYGALNTAPGRATLTRLGEQYGTKTPWDKLTPETKSYIDLSARRVTALNARVEELRPKADPALAAKRQPSTKPSPAQRVREVPPIERPRRAPSPWPFVLGAAILIGGMARVSHRRHRAT